MTPDDPAVAALVERGLAVVPGDGNKVPKVRWRRWQTEAQAPEEVAQLGHGSVYGVVSGARAGFAVIDADGPEGMATLERLGLVPHVLTPGGAHVWVEHPGHKVKTVARPFPDKYPGIDIRGDGGIAWAAGRSTKGVYTPAGEWPPKPVSLSPEAAADLFPPPAAEAERAPAAVWLGAGAGDPGALRYLERAASDVRAAGSGTSNAVLNKVAFSVGGLVAAGQLDPDHATAVLLRAADDRGAGSPEAVISAAMEAGASKPWTFDPRPMLATYEDDGTEWEPVLGGLSIEDLTPSQVADEDEQARAAVEASRTWSLREVVNRPPIRWLLPGLLQEGVLAEMVGPSSSGKSLLALRMALQVAERRGSRVLYVAAEGVAGFGGRLRAVAADRGVSVDALIDGAPGLVVYGRDGAFLDLSDDEAVDDVLRWFQDGWTYDLVIIDTLARSMPGAEENSASDLGRVIRAAERLKVGNGTVLLVHHSGHEAAGRKMRGRGSSAVFAACDQVIHVEPKPGADGRDGSPLEVKVWMAKLKDGAPPPAKHFRSREVVVGEWDGEVQTSVVLEPVDTPLYDGEAVQAAERADVERRVREFVAQGLPWSAREGECIKNKFSQGRRPLAKQIHTALVAPERTPEAA